MWLLALIGCVVRSQTTSPELEPGTLTLTWNVGAGGCDDAGVTEVEISVGSATEALPCEDGGATITADPGHHDLSAVGFDADGAPRYEGSTSVTLSEGQETTAHVTLSALPARLEVTWYFENGRLCAANGVSDVHLTLFDDEDYAVAEADQPCDGGIATIEDLDAGVYVVAADALDDGGARLFSGTVPVDLGKGDAGTVEVELRAE